MAAVPKFRIDVNVRSLLMNSASHGPETSGQPEIDLAGHDIFSLSGEVVRSWTRDSPGKSRLDAQPDIPHHAGLAVSLHTHSLTKVHVWQRDCVYEYRSLIRSRGKRCSENS